MPWFTPPSVTEHRPARDPFWFATQDRGLTVLREAGVWVLVDVPTDDRVQAAEVAYRGGYRYEVSDPQAAELVAAGFTVERSMAYDGDAEVYDGDRPYNGVAS